MTKLIIRVKTLAINVISQFYNLKLMNFKTWVLKLVDDAMLVILFGRAFQSQASPTEKLSLFACLWVLISFSLLLSAPRVERLLSFERLKLLVVIETSSLCISLCTIDIHFLVLAEIHMASSHMPQNPIL